MGSFYALLSTGENPAAALRNAKMQWLQGQQNGQQFQKLPYYWAGMVYSGDNKRVEIRRPGNESKWKWIVIFVAMAAIIYFIKKEKLFLK